MGIQYPLMPNGEVCFNHNIYKQIEGVSLGSLLFPILENIMIAERESTIVKNLFDQSLVKLYIRYIKDTLILIKEKDINLIQKWYEKVDLLDIGTARNKKKSIS